MRYLKQLYFQNVNLPHEDINSDISFSLEPGKENDKDFKIEELNEKSNQKIRP